MDNTQRQQLKKYADLVIERWRLITGCLFLSITVGLGYYLSVPKIYQGTSLLSYEQQQINPTKMDPEQGRIRLQEAVATLQELVMSRNSLEKVITQFSLYEKAREKLPIEDIIEMMRKKITISPAARGDVFSVAYQGQHPEKVMKVTNALASLFIEENLKYREERATETSRFTQDELEMAKKVMDEKEQLMRDYKLKHYNEMPDQRAGNLERLNMLNQQSQRLHESLQNLERTRIMAQEQVAMLQRLSAANAAREPMVQPNAPNASPQLSDADRLEQLHRYYNSMLNKYTDKHPEVKRTKQLIEQLEGQVGKNPSPRQTQPPASLRRATPQDSAEIGRLQIQIGEYETNIKQLRTELASLPSEIAKYQRWLEATPVREAEWNALTRDYNELRKNYDELVARNLQAQSTETLERKQKGSKFKIVDPARLPDKPFKPNFLKLFMATIVVGMGLGLAGTFLLDFMDTSFKDAGEIEKYIGVPVVCAITYISKGEEDQKEKRNHLLSVSMFSAYGLLLMVTMGYLWLKGFIII